MDQILSIHFEWMTQCEQVYEGVQFIVGGTWKSIRVYCKASRFNNVVLLDKIWNVYTCILSKFNYDITPTNLRRQ